VFDEEEVNLFLNSLMGTTIQDGGSRERKDADFFLIQRFITRGMRADHGNYLVATVH